MASYDNYVRYTRLHSVRETPTGIIGELHGEFFRIDVIRDDVVRFKISRGGTFDETPTYAVSADLSELAVDFTTEVSEKQVIVTTSSLVTTIGCDPFCLDVRRTDGSVVFETAPRKIALSGTSLASTAATGTDGFLTYATLNDAFTFSRRRDPGDAFFGLGEKTGAGDRSGRDFTLWNIDVLNPSASGEFASTRIADDPRSDNKSTEFDPYYMSIPFFYHRDAATGAMSGSFVDNGYRASYDFSPGDRFQLSDCAKCGLAGPHEAFNPQAGGMVCRRCRPPASALPSTVVIGFLSALLTGDWVATRDVDERDQRTASGLVSAFANWHLERGLRSLVHVDR